MPALCSTGSSITKVLSGERRVGVAQELKILRLKTSFSVLKDQWARHISSTEGRAFVIST
jgi:hypothetical protein